MNIKLQNVPTGSVVVVEKEGRHTRVLGFYPNTPDGKKRAHRRWEKAYIRTKEELERVPVMLRQVNLDIVLA